MLAQSGLDQTAAFGVYDDATNLRYTFAQYHDHPRFHRAITFGETVLLGRGGSDTSAALFAAKIGAERCEIWTDVPVTLHNNQGYPDARCCACRL